jgi:hypothetical protein
MTEAKGVPQILRAWLNLADELGPDCPPLWLVGGEPHEIEAMRHAADSDALADYESRGLVKWWGYLDPAGLSTVMLKAYVLVTHSLYEPGGRVVVEAMAQGIPVIATPNGFAADLITDWHNGFLVAYGDECSLRTRMSHFALQPLLRHAMGRSAQQVASAILDKWDFMDTHLRIYKCAARRSVGDLAEVTGRSYAVLTAEPPPRGFGGVYPFEGERVDSSEAAAFLSRHAGEEVGDVVELARGAKSRLWVAQAKGCRWVVKHAFSTYNIRPMWDRGYAGSATTLQRFRVVGEALASSCNGSATLMAADEGTGLLLREWLEPAVVDKSSLGACARLLTAFHNSRPSTIDLEAIRILFDRDWRRVGDEEVMAELSAIDAGWRAVARPWNAWQQISVRLGWRWLQLGLRKGWLRFPAGTGIDLDAWIDEEGPVAAAEERKVSFGLCHGDPDPAHFRMDADGRMVLIDCERLHPGYYGHDWAGLVLGVLDSTTGDGVAAEVLRLALDVIEQHLCSRRLLLSWLRLTTAIRICRASALMDKGAAVSGILGWQKVERLVNW